MMKLDVAPHPMRRLPGLRLVATLCVAGLVMSALPATADSARPLPEACNGASPVRTEGEVLVEHTLYLHGTTRVGTVDQVQDYAAGAPTGKKFMSPEAPMGSDFKVDPVSIGLNSTSNGNPHMAYWWARLPAGTRIVCAGATFFGSAQGTLTAMLFSDRAWMEYPPQGRQYASATGTETVKTWNARFGVVDLVPNDGIVFQIAPSAAGAIFYDSVEYPSKFTYVTTQNAP